MENQENQENDLNELGMLAKLVSSNLDEIDRSYTEQPARDYRARTLDPKKLLLSEIQNKTGRVINTNPVAPLPVDNPNQLEFEFTQALKDPNHPISLMESRILNKIKNIEIALAKQSKVINEIKDLINE